MADSNINSNELLLGAAVGGLLVAGSIALIRAKCHPKETGLTKKYNDYKDKIEEFLLDLEDNLETKVSDKTKDWYKTLKETSENLKSDFNSVIKEEHGELKAGLIAGGLLGALLGMEATKLYYSKEISQGQSDIKSIILENAPNWKKLIIDALEIAANRYDNKENPKTNRVSDVIDFVDTGLQLWKSVQKKSR